jgi:hypothetical protein
MRLHELLPCGMRIANSSVSSWRLAVMWEPMIPVGVDGIPISPSTRHHTVSTSLRRVGPRTINLHPLCPRGLGGNYGDMRPLPIE